MFSNHSDFCFKITIHKILKVAEGRLKVSYRPSNYSKDQICIFYYQLQTDSSVKNFFDCSGISASHSLHFAHIGNLWLSFLSGPENFSFTISIRNLPTTCTMDSDKLKSVPVLSFILEHGTSQISLLTFSKKKNENSIKFFSALFFQQELDCSLSYSGKISSDFY